ncbi:MAG: alpha/beta hydrolase [Rickettsiaceae bacterium]
MPEVFFNGPAGRIEGKFAESTNPKAPIALVLHPHPQFGGTMNNKIVYSLYKTLFENDFTVLRINFRGVGRSLGEYDEGVGEMTDAATALDWLQIHYPMSKATLIAGFSFGAWIAMQLIMRRPEITNFVTVSPPVNKYDFSFLSPCPIPGLIIQGDKDSVVSEDSVHELAQRLSKQKNIDVAYKVIAGADHFFRDKIDLLTEEVDEYLKATFAGQIGKPAKNANPDIQTTTHKKVFLD